MIGLIVLTLIIVICVVGLIYVFWHGERDE